MPPSAYCHRARTKTEKNNFISSGLTETRESARGGGLVSRIIKPLQRDNLVGRPDIEGMKCRNRTTRASRISRHWMLDRVHSTAYRRIRIQAIFRLLVVPLQTGPCLSVMETIPRQFRQKWPKNGPGHRLRKEKVDLRCPSAWSIADISNCGQ